MKAKLIKFFRELFPSKEEDGVLSQYQKMVLDKTPEPSYTGGTLGHSGVVGATGSVSHTEERYIGKVIMLETPKPVVTVENIVGAVENKYPKAIVELATILRDMKVQYSLHASAFSSKLFDAQDALGLTSEEVRSIIGHIIDQKNVIIDTTQSAINIINKPK